jgi:hypothetical protein
LRITENRYVLPAFSTKFGGAIKLVRRTGPVILGSSGFVRTREVRQALRRVTIARSGLIRTTCPQPDCLLFVQPEHAGRVRISEDGYIEGAPDLVAEVAASSVSLDVGSKLESYRKNGVRGYVVWRVLERQINWFVLRDDAFEPLNPAADGILRSEVFPGLWLDPVALIRGDVNAVLAVVQRGLISPEHLDFVARLERARID